MAKLDVRKLPDYAEKQRLFFGNKVSEHELRDAALMAEDAGIISDALDLFARLQDTEAMRRLQVRVQNEGDFFLFEKASKLMGEQADAAALDKLGERAIAQGKYLAAQKAFERSGNQEQLAKVQKLVQESGESDEQEKAEQE